MSFFVRFIVVMIIIFQSTQLFADKGATPKKGEITLTHAILKLNKILEKSEWTKELESNFIKEEDRNFFHQMVKNSPGILPTKFHVNNDYEATIKVEEKKHVIRLLNLEKGLWTLNGTELQMGPEASLESNYQKILELLKTTSSPTVFNISNFLIEDANASPIMAAAGGLFIASVVYVAHSLRQVSILEAQLEECNGRERELFNIVDPNSMVETRAGLEKFTSEVKEAMVQHNWVTERACSSQSAGSKSAYCQMLKRLATCNSDLRIAQEKAAKSMKKVITYERKDRSEKMINIDSVKVESTNEASAPR